ncbi:hypothetical protein ACLB2K_067434 [Fragaria x ananassa]
METEPQESNPQNDAVISSFCEITSASHQEARFFLESHNWDLDAAVSTFFENDAAAVDDATVAVTNPVPASHSLSPSPSHSPEYSPSQSPTRSRSPSPAPSRPAYQLRSKRAASGSSKEDNKPPAARTRGGIRTLSDLNRRPVKDGSDSDDDEPNEYYTGGEKSGMLVQDPTRGGAGDVDSIFAQARQFHQAPLEPSSSSRSFTGTARTLTGETVPAAAPPPPESINHTITFWNNGFTVDDGPLRRVDDPANAAFMESIKKSECPEELEPPSRMTTVEVSLIKREEDYREPVKQRSQAAFQGVGRTLGGSTSESAASESTAAAGPPLTTAPLPSMGLSIDQSLPSTSIQLRLADGTRMVSRFNNHHTIRDIHAFIDASRPGGPPQHQHHPPAKPQNKVPEFFLAPNRIWRRKAARFSKDMSPSRHRRGLPTKTRSRTRPAQSHHHPKAEAKADAASLISLTNRGTNLQNQDPELHHRHHLN